VWLKKLKLELKLRSILPDCPGLQVYRCARQNGRGRGLGRLAAVHHSLGYRRVRRRAVVDGRAIIGLVVWVVLFDGGFGLVVDLDQRGLVRDSFRVPVGC
jgi:hypothetical protein